MNPAVAALSLEVRQAEAVLRELRRRLREAKGATPRKVRVSIRTRPKGGTWKADRDEADKLMARVVKAEHPSCMACGTTDRRSLQWSHGISRGRLNTRYDFVNSFVHCSRCHLRFTRDSAGFTAWLIERLGRVVYEGLYWRSRLRTRFDPNIVVYLRGRAAELGVDSDEGWRAWLEGA
jgi:hypothetical protein